MLYAHAMDIARLRHIVAVADTLSFSRAAEQQNITQPALSRSIAAFENRHGLKLFDRGRGGVTITPAGEFVVAEARSLLRSADELTRNLQLYAQGAAGRVAFGIGPLVASLLLPRLSGSLLSSSPNLEIATVIKSPVDLLASLYDDSIEMIIGNDWQLADAHGIAIEEIAFLDLAHVARAGHPLARKDRVTPEDLAAYPAARPVRLNMGKADAGTFICDNYYVLRETVLHSDCTWTTAPAFVEDDLANGRLIALNVEGLALAKSRICIITLAGRTRSPAARTVADLARQVVRGWV
ncbi:LysR family transcriptional regulator [Novosphingobium album (ex Hu et al. 2023)]|uniref:LysR family transcriptional regulator n=1 Tax=Novosphingobium album (ex Hu et al. 2023) TaxID=2930093 RepID=A0ABT0B282_9SPHN|nr:LysR family transcriptional regulator [Novosphingobium album (ex Hu et al. 2023)]MCJ2179167.1 LysR family transcriptional regulator [Novosphingobium album (ex Hu et al. 2023)]